MPCVPGRHGNFPAEVGSKGALILVNLQRTALNRLADVRVQLFARCVACAVRSMSVRHVFCALAIQGYWIRSESVEVRALIPNPAGVG